MIPDTAFLLAVLRGDVEDNEQAQDILGDADSSEKVKVSAIKVMELSERIYFPDATQTEWKRVVDLLTGLHEDPFNREMGMLAVKLSAALISDGNLIEETAVMIGATVRVVDEPVVTRNDEHFERLDGVKVLTH